MMCQVVPILIEEIEEKAEEAQKSIHSAYILVFLDLRNKLELFVSCQRHHGQLEGRKAP